MQREATRIVNVPRVNAADLAPIGAGFALRRAEATGDLWPAQVQALVTFALYGGVVAQLGCGDGKGLVSMLAPAVVAAERPVVLVPSKLLRTFGREWARFAGLGFRLPTNIEVRSHDYVSRHSTWIDEYKPDCIFLDEGHAFRNPTAARTRRLMRYLCEHPTIARGGRIAFGVASGTLAGNSIADCAHLMTHALGERSPLPLYVDPYEGLSSELAAWANALDPDGRPGPSDWHAVQPLIDAFGSDFADALQTRSAAQALRYQARDAYDKRRRCTPGVVVSDSLGVGASLIIVQHKTPKPPDRVNRALQLVKSGTDPLTGDPIEDDAAQWRMGQQLSIGCFYRWDWTRVNRPNPDNQWLWARSAWARAVHAELRQNARPEYDSPGYVQRAVERGDPETQHLQPTWRIWSGMRDRYRVEDLLRIDVVDRFFVDALVHAVRAEPTPVIVWYRSAGCERMLADAGLPVFGADSDAPSEAITCALSIDRHGTGKNLQDRWSTCYFAEFPTSGERAEQTLARLHRQGQLADECTAHVYTHTGPFVRNLRQARTRAEFLSRTQGRQRLSIASFIIGE